MVLLQNWLLVVFAIVFMMLLLSVLYWSVVNLKVKDKTLIRNSVNLQFVNDLINLPHLIYHSGWR